MTTPRPPTSRAHLLVQAIAFAMLALVVMWWRLGGTIEDSQAYFDTARYLKGEIAKHALRAPFPYRIGVPGLVALFPFDTRWTFAILNWLFVSASAMVVAATARGVFASARAGWMAGLLLIFSFSTFWFAPYLVVDPGSLLARSVFVMGVVLGRQRLAQVAACAAVLVREENILLIGWLLLTRRVSLLRGSLLLLGAGAWLVCVRWYLIPGLPSYTWSPSLGSVIAALHDWRSLLTIALTAGLVLPMALAGWRRAPEPIARLKSLVLLLAMPSLYAALCVRVDGRAVWGMYPLLIPFAVSWASLRPWQQPRH